MMPFELNILDQDFAGLDSLPRYKLPSKLLYSGLEGKSRFRFLSDHRRYRKGNREQIVAFGLRRQELWFPPCHNEPRRHS